MDEYPLINNGLNEDLINDIENNMNEIKRELVCYKYVTCTLLSILSVSMATIIILILNRK